MPFLSSNQQCQSIVHHTELTRLLWSLDHDPKTATLRTLNIFSDRSCWSSCLECLAVISAMENKLDISTSHSKDTFSQGAYKFGKMKSPSFPGLPDPLNSLFHTIIMLKPDVANHLTSHFGTFLALKQNYRIYFLRSMVTGSTHASHCVTQPNYATVTNNYDARK